MGAVTDAVALQIRQHLIVPTDGSEKAEERGAYRDANIPDLGYPGRWDAALA